MSLMISENQSCPYANTCEYNSGKGIATSCSGADQNRKIPFICDLVTSEGVPIPGKFRSQLDKTGQMKIILE